MHHTDLAEALAAMRQVTEPGGRILIIGCYRAATAFGYAIEVVAVPANMLVGLVKSRGARPGRHGMSARTAPPLTSLAEVRHVAAQALPGARIQRRLFWCYTLTYTRN